MAWADNYVYEIVGIERRELSFILFNRSQSFLYQIISSKEQLIVITTGILFGSFFAGHRFTLRNAICMWHDQNTQSEKIEPSINWEKGDIPIKWAAETFWGGELD